jgi:hypothetical protein
VKNKTKVSKEKIMKKAFTTLIIVAALVAGSVSFAQPKTGGFLKTAPTTSSLK